MESFEQVAVQYKPMIYKIINSLHIYANKDEFYQIGLIGLWEAFKRFDPEKGEFMSYAYSYIKGKLMTEMKQSNKHTENSFSAPEEMWEYMVDEGSICPLEEETLLAYCQAAELTENQTKWVLYSCLKQFTIQEIADIEHVSLSAVKQWRAGAKQKLRNAHNLHMM